jgi:hypothetical protein
VTDCDFCRLVEELGSDLAAFRRLFDQALVGIYCEAHQRECVKRLRGEV